MKISEPEIRSALDKLSALPARVSGWQIETGLDWVDQPAVWVWAVLEDEEVDAAALDRLQETIRDCVHRAAGEAKWVYARFRGAFELAQVA